MSTASPLPHKVLHGAEPGPHLLITGGVHGDEFEPMAAVRRLIRILEQTSFRGQATLVPVANEAAFLKGTRTAEDGLDLARVFPGRVDGDVTERTAHAVAELIRQADYYIDLHTGGATLALAPLTGYVLHRDPKVLDVQRRMAKAFNLPIVWGTDWRLEGRSLSTARDAGVPAIYAEYLGGGVCRPEGVSAYVEGCLNVMAELKMLDRESPPSAVKYLIEDERPASGHLQIHHPAPMAGFFEPHVALEDHVQQGGVLGVVSDILGENVRPVRAEQTGFVLGLRIFPRVLPGDTLAVILEI